MPACDDDDDEDYKAKDQEMKVSEVRLGWRVPKTRK